MAAAGEDKAAYAWLDRVLAAESRWKPEEEENLRTCYAELLRQQGRYDDVVEYLGAYVKRNPPGATFMPSTLARWFGTTASNRPTP